MIKENPYYRGHLEWKDLPASLEGLRWPDQVGNKGRPRAIKFGHMRLVLSTGVQAKAARSSEEYYKWGGSPYLPVYRTTTESTIRNIKSRFCMSKFPTLVPEIGIWDFKIVEREQSGWAGWYYLYARYDPPAHLSFMHEFPLVWYPSGQWLNSMIAAQKTHMTEWELQNFADGATNWQSMAEKERDRMLAQWIQEADAEDDDDFDPEFLV